MTKITFTTPDDGTEYTVPFHPGESIMTAAVNNDVPGIEGECGGDMNCGTCHVWVAECWRDKFTQPDWDEGVMLDIVEGRTEASRLGCQLILTPEHDGIGVTVATGEA